MRKITLLGAFMLINFIGNAQSFQWAKQIAGTTTSAFSVNVKDLRPISNGHVFVCGSFTGSVDFDPTSATLFKTAQGTDGFVAQYDSGGNLLWIYTTDEIGNEEAVALHVNANFATPKLNVVFQIATTSCMLRSFNLNDGTIFSNSPVYSATGSLNITSMNADAQLSYILIGGSYSGSLTIEGTTHASAGQLDAFVAKFETTGTSAAQSFVFGWLRSYGGTGNDQVNAVGFYGQMSCGGYFENTADFDGDPTTTTLQRTAVGGKDCIKIDLDYTNGNTQRAIAIGSTGDDAINAIGDTDVFAFAGYFSNTFPIDPTDVDNNLVSSGGKDGFVARYNPDTYFWAKKIGGTNDDEVIKLTKSATSPDIYYAAKLGSATGSATLIGSYAHGTGLPTSFGGIFLPSNQTTQNAPLCIAQEITFTTGIFTSGIFNATTDFDPQAGTASITPVSGGNNGYLQKMSLCNTAAGTPTISGSNSVCLGQSITLTVGNSATLNNNNEWKWYTGSCGGTLVGTGLSITVSPSVQTTYYVRGEGGCVASGNCSAAKTVSIITTLPNNAVTVSGNTLTATQTSATYQWIDCNNGNSNISGATAQSYTPTLSGTYAVRITNASGCTVTSSCTALTVCNPATNPGIVGAAGFICAGQSKTLTATGNLNESLEWKWYTGSCGGTLIGTGPSVTVSPNVTTAYYCRGEGGCTQFGLCRTVNVQVNALPSDVVTLSGGTLTAAENNATYQWVDCDNGNSDIVGATNQSYIPSANGNYAVKITNTSGCQVISVCTQVTVCQVAGTPTISTTQTSLCNGQSRTLTVNGNLNGNTTWNWYTNSCGGTLIGTGTSITVSPTQPTNYFVRGEGGCANNGNCSNGLQLIVYDYPPSTVTLSGNTLTANAVASANYQWLDCNNGNATIPGATAQSFTPNASGSYAVRISPPTTCSVTSSCTQVNVLSVSKFEKLGLHLYPNPADNAFAIKGSVIVQQVNLYNIVGQKVKTFDSGTTTYLVGELSNGVYTVEVITEKGSATAKLVKQ